jgi:hypothetical protein
MLKMPCVPLPTVGNDWPRSPKFRSNHRTVPPESNRSRCRCGGAKDECRKFPPPAVHSGLPYWARRCIVASLHHTPQVCNTRNDLQRLAKRAMIATTCNECNDLQRCNDTTRRILAGVVITSQKLESPPAGGPNRGHSGPTVASACDMAAVGNACRSGATGGLPPV